MLSTLLVMITKENIAQVSATNTTIDNNGSAIGDTTTATGNNSFAQGYLSQALGNNSLAMGYKAKAEQLRSNAIGFYAECNATSSFAIGNYVTSYSDFGFVIGSGAGSATNERLVNPIFKSLMIGFGSTKPTFFVGKSDSYNKTGRIGIGDVSSPQAKLHIRGDEGENAELFLEPTGTHTISKISFGSQDRSINRNSNIMNFVMKSEEFFKFQGGKVGINLGSFDPEYELDVAGNINFSGTLYQDGTTFRESPWVHDNNPTSRIIYSGEVAIGEPSTWLHKLTVDGDVLFRGQLTADDIEVKEIGAWKDEVFTPEYKLLSITETEFFIKTNGHLPDLPSEAEVLENGYKLSEMDALLLQKIEELTLYIIEQQKEIDKLKTD